MNEKGLQGDKRIVISLDVRQGAAVSATWAGRLGWEASTWNRIAAATSQSVLELPTTPQLTTTLFAATNIHIIFKLPRLCSPSAEPGWQAVSCARRSIVSLVTRSEWHESKLTAAAGHVFGKSTRKESCYDNLHISRNAWDTNLVKVGSRRPSANVRS